MIRPTIIADAMCLPVLHSALDAGKNSVAVACSFNYALQFLQVTVTRRLYMSKCCDQHSLQVMQQHLLRRRQTYN